MALNKFIQNIADQFEDTDTSGFNADTRFRDIEDYSSLIGMSIIAMVGEKYKVTITGKELRSAVTIKELFNLVISKCNGDQ